MITNKLNPNYELEYKTKPYLLFICNGGFLATKTSVRFF